MTETDQKRTDGGVSEDVDDWMDEHPLVALFDDTPRTRLIVAFLEAGEPLNPTRIWDKAGIAEKTWYNHKDELLETGLIVQSGHHGNSPLYRLAIPDGDELPEGDRRAEWLDKITDWTGRQVYDKGEGD